MSVGITEYYRLGPVGIGSGGTTILGGITDAGLTGGAQILKEPVSGEIGVRTAAISAIQPTGSFTTKDIETALNACGSLGLTLFATNQLHIYATKVDTQGTIAAGAVHRLWTCRGGLLYPTRLSCEHRGDASLTYEARLAHDGTNDPIIASNAALPAAASNNLWTLQAASVGGFGATDLQGIDIDFGIQCNGVGANSEVYDNQMSIDGIQPVVTIRSNELSTMLDLEGAAEATGSITFRKREHGGTYTEDTFVIGFAGLCHATDVFRGQQQGGSQQSVVCEVEWDGDGAPFSLT